MTNKIKFNNTTIDINKEVISGLDRILKLIRPDVQKNGDIITIIERDNKYTITNTLHKSISNGFTR